MLQAGVGDELDPCHEDRKYRFKDMELVLKLESFFKDHVRSYKGFRYVYPVISRRSKGVSIGINLSPHKRCNFDCLYCQVDRSIPGAKQVLDFDELKQELSSMVKWVQNGELFEQEHFATVPQELRVLKDIALSGDGEPTAEPCFAEVCSFLKSFVRELGLEHLKVVVITNSTMFHKEKVVKGLSDLMEVGGVIWAKLDAGTEAYYKTIDLSSVPFSRVLENLKATAQRWPITIQTLFCSVDGDSGPSDEELASYARQLLKIVEEGGSITEVQIHTVAREPGNHDVKALKRSDLLVMGETVQAISGLPVQVIGGQAD